MGGVFNTVNLHLYHYAGNNPVRYTDPNGMADEEKIIPNDGPVGFSETLDTFKDSQNKARQDISEEIQDYSSMASDNIETLADGVLNMAENSAEFSAGEKSIGEYIGGIIENALNTASELKENIKGALEDSEQPNIPKGTWAIERPNGSKAEIDSGHGHFDRKTRVREDPHTHEFKDRVTQDPNFNKGPIRDNSNVHKPTPEDYQIWKDTYGE